MEVSLMSWVVVTDIARNRQITMGIETKDRVWKQMKLRIYIFFCEPLKDICCSTSGNVEPHGLKRSSSWNKRAPYVLARRTSDEIPLTRAQCVPVSVANSLFGTFLENTSSDETASRRSGFGGHWDGNALIFLLSLQYLRSKRRMVLVVKQE